MSQGAFLAAVIAMFRKAVTEFLLAQDSVVAETWSNIQPLSTVLSASNGERHVWFIGCTCKMASLRCNVLCTDLSLHKDCSWDGESAPMPALFTGR
eukprot:9450095-Ditylum_brightwellii.AAC.1